MRNRASAPPMLRAALVALVVLLAGCATPAAELASSSFDAADLPPGCDATRVATAHYAGGRAAEVAGPLPVPCALRGVGTSGGEPTIGVHPDTGALFYYPGVGRGPEVARSLDGGATWERIAPEVAGQRTHRLTLDPYLYLDPATGRLFADDLTTVNCSVTSFSDDGGETWTDTVTGCAQFDHQTIFAGPPALSPTVGYPNVVYRCAINLVALADASTAATCMKSLDGGLAFVPTGAPAYVTPVPGDGHLGFPTCDGATGHGAVGPDGTVYLPKGVCGVPTLAISKDEGATWTRVVVSDLGMSRGENGAWEHEAGVGADADGNVYYAWVARDRLPYLAVSRDGGRTWDEPRMVAPPGMTEAALPQLVVGGVGKVALAYMGSMDSPGAPFDDDLRCLDDVRACLEWYLTVRPVTSDATWGGYITMTVDALADDPTFFSASVDPADEPFVEGPCGPIRCQYVFDFLDVRIGPDGTPWAPFVDTCTPACVEDDFGEGVVGRLWGGPSLLDP